MRCQLCGGSGKFHRRSGQIRRAATSSVRVFGPNRLLTFESRRFPEYLPREVQVLDVPEEQRRHPCCGDEMPVVDTDVRERLEFIPAKFLVHELHYPKRACSKCKGTVNDSICGRTWTTCSVAWRAETVTLSRFFRASGRRRIRNRFGRTGKRSHWSALRRPKPAAPAGESWSNASRAERLRRLARISRDWSDLFEVCARSVRSSIH
jgi:transposase